MPKILWRGSLSPAVFVLANLNNLIAWMSGNTKNTSAMKQRVRQGYEGACSDHVTRYDDLALDHYTRIASKLLEGVDVADKQVLDVGCGTGVLSCLISKRGARRLISGDISHYMLSQCRDKMYRPGPRPTRVAFQQLDAESLPFSTGSFDVLVSGMMIGFVPDPSKALTEMARVLRPGGEVAISTHGPGHYKEAIDAAFRVISKRHILGYRVEFWPTTGRELEQLLGKNGFVGITTKRLTWKDSFEDGSQTYDFFASSSGSWWYAKFPPNKIKKDSARTRAYFERKRISEITHDVILAYGRKPRSG